MVIIIIFVLVCASAYMILINGAYMGSAIHVIPDLQNESYPEYYTSNSESES